MSSTLTSAKHNLPLPLLFMDFNFTTFEQMHQVRATQANDSVHLLSAKMNSFMEMVMLEARAQRSCEFIYQIVMDKIFGKFTES